MNALPKPTTPPQVRETIFAITRLPEPFRHNGRAAAAGIDSTPQLFNIIGAPFSISLGARELIDRRWVSAAQ